MAQKQTDSSKGVIPEWVRGGWEVMQDAMGQVQAINFYRGRLETHLNQRFDDTEWRAMVDLGHLVDALRSTCFSAYWYKHTDEPNDRPRLEIEVKVRNQQVRDAQRWL